MWHRGMHWFQGAISQCFASMASEGISEEEVFQLKTGCKKIDLKRLSRKFSPEGTTSERCWDKSRMRSSRAERSIQVKPGKQSEQTEEQYKLPRARGLRLRTVLEGKMAPWVRECRENKRAQVEHLHRSWARASHVSDHGSDRSEADQGTWRPGSWAQVVSFRLNERLFKRNSKNNNVWGEKKGRER